MADDQMSTSANEQVNPSTDERQTDAPVEPIRAPDVVEEESSEEEVEEPVHTAPRHVPVRYDIVARQYLQTFSLQALLFLQMMWTVLSRAANVTQSVSVGVVRSLQTQMYIFFQGSTYPYRLQNYTLSGPGIAPVEWYYNADTKVFVSSNLYNTSNEYQTHHFQWLSGEIQFNGLTLYDVTEFLQQVRWAGAAQPSTALVLSAWSLHSGIVLNMRDGLVLKTINQDGTESLLNVRV